MKRMYIQPFTKGVDWPEIWHLMEVSTMFYICGYCVFTYRADIHLLLKFSPHHALVVSRSPWGTWSSNQNWNKLGKRVKYGCYKCFKWLYYCCFLINILWMIVINMIKKIIINGTLNTCTNGHWYDTLKVVIAEHLLRNHQRFQW